MAALSEANAVIRVLDAIGRVSGDAQLPSATIIRKLDDEYRRLRRRLAAEFPSLYEKISASTTLTTTSTITKPTDCEFIRVVEKQLGSYWYPLQAAPSLNRDLVEELAFYEIGTAIQILPTASAAGVYRIIYVASPATAVTTYDVPDGVEGIIIEETAAWARQRHNEMDQVKYHKEEARRIWDEAYMGLWNRYGSHGRSAMNEVAY